MWLRRFEDGIAGVDGGEGLYLIADIIPSCWLPVELARSIWRGIDTLTDEEISAVRDVCLLVDGMHGPWEQ